MTRSVEHAERRMRKAAHDQLVVEKLLPDAAAPEEAIGFHARQALKKMLKAVLAARAIRSRRAHDLVELIDRLRRNGVSVPEEVDAARWLSPFAADYRDDDLPLDASGRSTGRWPPCAWSESGAGPVSSSRVRPLTRALGDPVSVLVSFDLGNRGAPVS